MSRRSEAAERLRPLWDALTAGDPEAIHRARKLSRRAGAELRVAEAGKKTERAWRELRRAAAPLRDHDVAGGHILQALEALGAPPGTRSAFARSWALRRSGLLAATRWPAPPPSFRLKKGWEDRARRLLLRDRPRLLAAGEAALASADPEVRHDWRKRLKRTRYTWALLGEVPPALTDILEALGRFQDAEVVLGLLETHPDLLRTRRGDLIAHEQRARAAAQEQVRELFPALAQVLAAELPPSEEEEEDGEAPAPAQED